MPSSPFPDRLLAWWDRHGRKDLPWQKPRNPYRVWVSEIMLQQTQVSAVIPYFERWMERFPNLSALATAPGDDVLAHWSGLGYYARARNLHKAARICTEKFGGNLPDSFEGLTKLPGIGPSTANAILSLAHDLPAAVLDGNVKRVLARHAGLEGWPGDSRVHKRLWREATGRLPENRAADYSQAIMDLGALVCLRNKPRCADCPVLEDCSAFGSGLTDCIPGPRPRKKVPDRTVHMMVVLDDLGRILLHRRPPTGIWGGLWSLPEGETPAEARAEIGLDDGEEVGPTHTLPEVEHRLTHLRLHIRPLVMTLPPASRLECGKVRDDEHMAWFGRGDLRNLGLPKPVNDLLHRYLGSE
jgi:A/G-specific adenine glycosylase